jgi:hypothetical protein
VENHVRVPGWAMFAYIDEWKDKTNHGFFPIVAVRTCGFIIQPWDWWSSSRQSM